MADRQLVMAPEVIFNESCCLSILLAVENGPPARAEGLVKLSVGEGEHRCSAAALGRSAARKPYAGKHDSDCGGLSQPDKLVQETPLVVAFVYACDAWRTSPNKSGNVDRYASRAFPVPEDCSQRRVLPFGSLTARPPCTSRTQRMARTGSAPITVKTVPHLIYLRPRHQQGACSGTFVREGDPVAA